jgi:hypothetical protein
MIEIKRGNYVELQITAKKNGATLTDLFSAANITFMLKQNADDPESQAILVKDYLTGIVPNSPTTGKIMIPLYSTDTENIEPAIYYFGIQIKYTDQNRQELFITDPDDAESTTNRIQILQDVVF